MAKSKKKAEVVDPNAYTLKDGSKVTLNDRAVGRLLEVTVSGEAEKGVKSNEALELALNLRAKHGGFEKAGMDPHPNRSKTPTIAGGYIYSITYQFKVL